MRREFVGMRCSGFEKTGIIESRKLKDLEKYSMIGRWGKEPT